MILATSLGRMEMVRTRQYHHSNNSDMEDSTVTPSKTDYYVPVSALCAESTINRVLLKLEILLHIIDMLFMEYKC